MTIVAATSAPMTTVSGTSQIAERRPAVDDDADQGRGDRIRPQIAARVSKQDTDTGGHVREHGNPGGTRCEIQQERKTPPGWTQDESGEEDEQYLKRDRAGERGYGIPTSAVTPISAASTAARANCRTTVSSTRSTEFRCVAIPPPLVNPDQNFGFEDRRCLIDISLESLSRWSRLEDGSKSDRNSALPLSFGDGGSPCGLAGGRGVFGVGPSFLLERTG